MATKKPTQEDEDEKKIREIEGKITEVIELLDLQRDFPQKKQRVQELHAKTRNDKTLTFMKHESKHKNIAITNHAHGNMELIDILKKQQKFSDHPSDLLSHLDSLTDMLLLLIQKQSKKK
jgi:hypothetical protein